MKNSVAIITARGGSKRIPRKNIKDFLGKPILAYSIAAALESGCFDEVMVSTDDAEIAEVARGYGALVPFPRSAATSNDFACTNEVLREGFEQYRTLGRHFQVACCLYPTAPFVTPEKLRQGYRILQEQDADSAFPVTRFGFPIQRALKIENGYLEMICPENALVRSQDLMPAYHDAGQFYWYKVAPFLKNGGGTYVRAYPIVVPESEVQDIDNEEDWKIAEMKYRILCTGA